MSRSRPPASPSADASGGGVSAPVDRARDARDAVYREAILDAAETAFAESGYAGTKMSAVARIARISLSTLYDRYSDKMTLYRAVHARRLDALMARVRAVPGDAADPLTPMILGMRAYILFHTEHPLYLRMHLREGVAWTGPDPLLSPEQRAASQAGLDRMARAFERGMQAGLFVPDDPKRCARTVNALHQVALAHWIDTGMTEPPEDLVDRLAAQFVRTFCEPRHVLSLLDRELAR